MRPCPSCAAESRVYDSRYSSEVVRRRRECMSCKHRWTTFETNFNPKELINIGAKVRYDFKRLAERCKPASITANEQARIDRTASASDRKARNRKILHLYKTLTATEIAERMALPMRTVKEVIYMGGVRKRSPRGPT